MKEQFEIHLAYLKSVIRHLVNKHSNLIDRLNLLPFSQLFILLLVTLIARQAVTILNIIVLVGVASDYIYQRKPCSLRNLSVGFLQTLLVIITFRIALLSPFFVCTALLIVHIAYTIIKHALCSVFTGLNFDNLANSISSSRIGENVITGVILAPYALALFTIYLVYAISSSFCRAAISKLAELPKLTMLHSLNRNFEPADDLRSRDPEMLIPPSTTADPVSMFTPSSEAARPAG